ncbi:tetratricopeptide repeat protein [Thalassotalea montiporae]
MSVINQMLQDLEKRNTPAGDESVTSSVVVSAPQKSHVLPIVLSVFITAIIAAALWLYHENQSLKQQTSPQARAHVAQQDVITQADTNAKSSTNSQSTALPMADVEQVPNLNGTKKDAKKDSEQTDIQADVKAKQTIPSAEPVTQSLEPQQNQLAEVQQHRSNTQVQEEVLKGAELNQPKAQSALLSQSTQASIEQEPVKQEPKPAPLNTKPLTTKPSLTIARKQLTSAQLAVQKVNQAERAMAEKEGQKAEQLLQDALLLAPESKNARKQLAAIWFARGANQAAMNLLNQGISLSPNEPDFRLMKAKILLKNYQQSQSQSAAQLSAQTSPQLAQAFETLVALANVPQVEYQSMLATVAQQYQQLSAAVSAYQQLVLLQPNQAKWHLGLAIAFDQSSQFNDALNAYQQALAVGGLSLQTQQFAQQRMTELGE